MIPGANRVPELLGQVKFEYDTLNRECERYKRERDEFERKIQTQIQEMDVIQQTLKLLQSNQTRLQQQYESELNELTLRLRQSQGAANGNAAAIDAPAEKRPRVDAPTTTGTSISSQKPPPLKGARVQPRISDSAAAAAAQIGVMNWVVQYSDSSNAAEGGGDTVPAGRPAVTLQHQLDHQSVVCCVRFSHDGTQMATGCKMKAQVFNVDSGEQVFDMSRADGNKKADGASATEKDAAGEADGDEEEYVRAVCFSPDGKNLLAAMPLNTIKIWDIANQKETMCLQGHQAAIYSLDYVGNLIASGSGDKFVRLWDPAKGNCMATLGDDVNGPKEGITCVSLSPDARFLAAASLDKMIRIWDTQTQTLLGALQGHSESVYSIAFSPDGKQVVSGSLDCTLMLWDVEQSGLTSADGVASKRASPSSGAAAPDSKCQSVVFRGHDDFVLSVGYTPNGQWLLSGSKDRSVKFWDPRSNASPVLSLWGYRNSVISVASSASKTAADGAASAAFATGSGDNFACLWKYTC